MVQFIKQNLSTTLSSVVRFHCEHIDVACTQLQKDTANSSRLLWDVQLCCLSCYSEVVTLSPCHLVKKSSKHQTGQPFPISPAEPGGIEQFKFDEPSPDDVVTGLRTQGTVGLIKSRCESISLFGH